MHRLIFILIILFLSVNCLALQKNVANQKWIVYAYDSTDDSIKTGDSANITANLRIDGVQNAVDDTNPTELEGGYYEFTITNTESNGDNIVICPVSSTGNIIVIGYPRALWTTPPYFSTLSIDSNGRLDIIKVAGTTQTANDNSADIDAILIGTVTNAQGADVATDVAAMIDGSNRIDVGSWLGQAVTLSTGNKPDVNINEISDDSGAADTLELQYDGTGLVGDPYPLRQDQGAGIAGGLAVHTTMTSVTVILGSEQDIANMATSDGARWTGDDDGSGAEFIFRCTPVDTSNVPVDFHFEGYYDEPTGSTNGATLQVYNFDTTSWNTTEAFSNASVDEIHDIALSHGHKATGSGTLETVGYTIGDVLIKFKQDTTETGNAVLLIDYMTVGFVGSLITATDIVDEWESQSQSDPTGFHVNVKEINGTGQTANDMSGDIDDILTATVIYSGGIASATSGTLVFDAGPVTTSDYYNKDHVVIISGTGVGQTRKILDWATLTASVVPAWVTNPASDSVATIIPFSSVHVQQFSATAKGEIESEVDDSIVTYKLDHLVYVADADDPVNNSIIAKMFASDGDWSGGSSATDALEAIADAIIAFVSGSGVNVTQVNSVSTGSWTSQMQTGQEYWFNVGVPGKTMNDVGLGGAVIYTVYNIPSVIDIAGTATVRFGMSVTDAVDDLPTTGEITPGTIKIEYKRINGTVWTTVVDDEACSEAAGLIYYDEVLNTASGYREEDALRITFKSQKVVISGNDFEITGTTGVTFHSYIRKALPDVIYRPR